MKLAISNIAWTAKDDAAMYEELAGRGYEGLEIAPTRIFPEAPYEHQKEAGTFAEHLKESYGLSVVSMQSIWFGRTEKLFGSEKERQELLTYTKKAIDFAEAVSCPNLVFGSPKNRVTFGKDCRETAVAFFRELGDYAAAKQTCLSLEANPAVYGTDFVNDTKEAFDLVGEVASDGFQVNIDFGTILENGENLDFFTENNLKYINHIHISEPGLALVQQRKMHRELAERLKELSYEKYVSIEMGTQESMEDILTVLDYVKEVFAS